MKKKICFYGAGAVGCTLAAKFANHADISLIARGPHLTALNEQGLTYINNNKTHKIRFACTDNPTSLPTQDIIFLTVKAYQLDQIAPFLPTMMHTNTIIIPICNGIPWWFCQSLEKSQPRTHTHCLDPNNILSKHIPLQSILGGVTYMGAEILEPGVVSNRFNPRLLIGEIDGLLTSRTKNFRALTNKAGFKNATSANIHGEILTKLCWNIAFNTLSVIYKMTAGELVENKESKNLAIKAIKELETLAKTLHIALSLNIADHLNIALKVGNHKPSMLQDYEAGKPLETSAIIDSVIEISHFLNIKTPTLCEISQKLHHS